MRLKELRKQKNYNQETVAKYLGVTQATLSGWENEKFEPDLTSLKKLAKLYNVSIDYLIDFDEFKIPEDATYIELDDRSYHLLKETKPLSSEDHNLVIEVAKRLKNKNKHIFYQEDCFEKVAENSHNTGMLKIGDDTKHN